MKKIILCDIDHTLFDSSWRDHMVTRREPGEENWDAYHEAADDDPSSQVMVDLIKTLQTVYSIIGLTAIPEMWRSRTRVRLLRAGYVLNGLLMRPEGNFDPSPVVKIKMARGAGDLSNVAFLLEDRDDVSKAFREAGVVVLQVHLTSGHAPSVPFLEEERA